jgi:hypothetical protein
MCTYIVYSNPGGDVPLLMATTRDENPTRVTSPAFQWDKDFLFTSPSKIGTITLHSINERGVQPFLDAQIIAPRDELLGGTFLAQNKYGVIAAVNNREHSPFKDDEKRKRTPGRDSGLRKMPRGGLPLEACSYQTAEEATLALWKSIKENQAGENQRKYSGFNFVIADTKGAWVITNAKAGDITVNNETRLEYLDTPYFSMALWKVPAGKVSMLGGFDLNDYERSARTMNHLPALDKLSLPKFNDIRSWQPWLNQMAYKQDYGSDPFGLSICQPNPTKPQTIGKGIAEWTTIATHLMLIGPDNQNWFNLEGQLIHGKLPIQTINRNHPGSCGELVFGQDSLIALPANFMSGGLRR